DQGGRAMALDVRATAAAAAGRSQAGTTQIQGFFWITSILWTVVAFVLRALGGQGGLPQIGLGSYLVVLACLYFLGGINIVSEWKRRPILLFGRYVATVGPGLAWVDPIFHRRLEDVPVRDVVSELRIGGVQTHDNVPISFNLIMTTRVDEGKVRDFIVH